MHNHSVVIALHLPRHVPCWTCTFHLLSLSFLNTSIIKLSKRMLKFYIISIFFFVEYFFQMFRTLNFFVSWFGFWITFYEIDMHPILCFTLLKHVPFVVLHLSLRGLLCFWCSLSLLKLWLGGGSHFGRCFS